MANRHGNKKLRRLVRQRMAETGETHQQALAALLSELGEPELPRDAGGHRHRRSAPSSGRGGLHPGAVDLAVDLIVAHYFGWPVTLAVFEAAPPMGYPVILRIPSFRDDPARTRMPLPLMSFRPAGCQ